MTFRKKAREKRSPVKEEKRSMQGRMAWKAGSAALVACTALAATSGNAPAQQYPTQDIQFICAFPAGSGSDVLVRYFAQKVSPLAGRNIIVINRPGAAGNIAMESVARSRPDGYTVYVHAASSAAASMHLFKKPPVDVPRQLAIAATINRQPYMVVVGAASPHRTIAELTAAMKLKGGSANYGAPNAVATVIGEIYKAHTGVQAVEVNYRSGPDMLNELTNGRLDYAAADPVFSLSQSREGRIRILAVSTNARLHASRELPTMTEQGVPMDVTGWWAAMVPAGTPRPVVDELNKWFVQVVGSEETRQFLAQFGGDPVIETPEAAQARLIKDIDVWAEWVRIARIQPQ
jgi:tripartite-type tricarboxylate transporter receptor subunit TctC